MKKVLSTKEAAERMRISEDAVRELCKNNLLEGATQKYNKGPWQIPITSVDQWITKNHTKKASFRRGSIFARLLQVIETVKNKPAIQLLLLLLTVAVGFASFTGDVVETWSNIGAPQLLPVPLVGPTAVVKGEQKEVLVLIAKFEQMSESPLEPHREWEVTLNKAVEQLRGQVNARVLPLSIVIKSHEEARRISNQYQATLVIWGRVRARVLESFYTTTPRWSAVSTLHNTTLQGTVEELALFVSMGGDSEYVFQSMLGQLAYHSGQYMEARTFFSKALAVVPEGREIELGAFFLYFYRGYAAIVLNDRESAIEDYTQAIRLNPYNASAYYNRGTAYHYMNRYQAALKDYTQAITIQADYSNAYYGRGEVHYMMGLYDNALADLNRAISINTNDLGYYYSRANIYTRLSRKEEADADLNKIIETEVHNYVDYLYRGMAYTNLERYDDALEDFKTAIAMKSDDALTYLNMGAAYAGAEKYDDALQNFTKAISIDPKLTEAYYNRGTLYSDQFQQYEMALSDLNMAISLNPYFAYAYGNRGVTFDLMGRYVEALADYQKALELNPSIWEVYNDRGGTYYTLERYDEAISDFSKAIELNPLQAEVYHQRALAYEKVNKPDLAALDRAQALEIQASLEP